MSVEPNKTSPKAMDEVEPKVGWSPTPVLLIGLMTVLIFWGFTHLEDHAGGFNKVVYEPYTSPNMVESLQFHDPVEIERLLGQKLFEANCAACHQSSGLGSPAQNAPPLAGSEWVNAAVPNRIVRIVLNGLNGPITVKGNQFGLGVMVPWRDTLKDDQIAAILTYIRGNKGWNNSASPVTAAQVKAIRDKTVTQAGPWKADDLLKIPERD